VKVPVAGPVGGGKVRRKRGRPTRLVEIPDDLGADQTRRTGGTIAGRFEIHPPLRESSAS
jgi:hypothetical protein